MTNLEMFQVDNNNFSKTSIPDAYKNMSHVLKLSFRNCSLQGPIPDLSKMVDLLYIDFSFNELSGSMTLGKISWNITTIGLSHNNLSGTIPVNLSGLPYLQRLSLANNLFNGPVSSIIWPNTTLAGNEALIVYLRQTCAPSKCHNKASRKSYLPKCYPNKVLWNSSRRCWQYFEPN
ncbi:hypothetical protein ACH5RR_026878 [Cinchona calisaya]|uniref:Uncharacterized protein n=1 Tax=Cinchona calisaya TaxID=153742 RepID=A0ABD2Z3V4_9GENT